MALSPDQIAYLDISFLILQPKPVLWVLKRTVSMTHILTDRLDNNYDFNKKSYLEIYLRGTFFMFVER